MTQKNDGGQAFPFVWFKSPDGMIGTNCTEGMTYLDYAAIAIRQSMGNERIYVDHRRDDGSFMDMSSPEYKELQRKATAEWCYAEARAMLAAREAK